MSQDPFAVKRRPDLSVFAIPTTNDRLRVCIATDEIYGPVRNGGIASTYFSLAKMLAVEGHHVTICFLKGERSESEPIEHWIQYYRSLNIELVPLPAVVQRLDAPHLFWQRRYYNFLEWLKSQPVYDVVHTSEWRGGAYYALLAKRLNLAFADTLFIVKSSSPHIWNRHYLMRSLDQPQMLGCMYAEQRTMELADIVVGGSAHLLSFMDYIGYKLPADGIFVQPNVVEMDVPDVSASRVPGQRLPIEEVVFFGRLEARKGLDIFCDALDILVEAGAQIAGVAFLGKEAQNLPTHPHLTNKEYILRRSKRWPFPCKIETTFDSAKALAYLADDNRLAVMPSVIENSTMAVYEALLHRVPFVATNVGGTAELVAPAYHDDVLTLPVARPLADRIADILERGGVIAECAFDNAENLEVWRGFHRFLATSIKEKGVEATIAAMRPSRAADQRHAGQDRGFSVCIYHAGECGALEDAILALCYQDGVPPAEIIVVLDAATSAADMSDAQACLKASSQAAFETKLTLHRAPSIGLGECYNYAAGFATQPILAFCRSDIHRIADNFLAKLTRAFADPQLAAVSSFYDVREDDDTVRYLPLGADIASGCIDRHAVGGGVIAVTAEAFRACNGFAEVQRVAGVEQEILLRLERAGRVFEVVPEALYVETHEESRLPQNEVSAQMLVMRSLTAPSSFPLKRLFLYNGHLVVKERERLRSAAAARRNIALSSELAESAPKRNGADALRWEIKPAKSDKDGGARLFVGFDLIGATFAFRISGEVFAGPSLSMQVKIEDQTLETIAMGRNASGSWVATWPTTQLLAREFPLNLTFEATGDDKLVARRQTRIVSPQTGTLEIRAAKPIIAVGGLKEFRARAAADPGATQSEGAQWVVDAPNEGPPARIQIAFDPSKVEFHIALHRSNVESDKPLLLVRIDRVDVASIPLRPVEDFYTARFTFSKVDASTQLVFAVRGGRFSDLRRGLQIEKVSETVTKIVSQRPIIVLSPGGALDLATLARPLPRNGSDNEPSQTGANANLFGSFVRKVSVYALQNVRRVRSWHRP